MAATQATVSIPATTWTRLNTGGTIAGAVSLYPLNQRVWIVGTISNVAPTGEPIAVAGAFMLPVAPGALVGLNMAQLWPGIVGTDIFAYCERAAVVAVSCA